MIPWFKCTPFELRAIVSLPPTVRKRFVAAREKQLARELETLPDFTEAEQIDLEMRGIETKLEKLCGRLLKDRERQSRTKAKATEDSSREPNVSVTCDSREPPSLVERVERVEREEKREKKKTPAAPRAKRAPMEERPLPDDWTPSETHRAFAEAHGIDIDIEAFAFREWSQGRMWASPNGRFATWLGKTAAQKKNAPTIKKTSPPGWNDGDMMFGIPKGKT